MPEVTRDKRTGLRVVTLAVTTAFALTGATGAPSAAGPPQPETRLPAWLAPGATLNIAGSAEPGTPVALIDGGSAIASAIAGDDGRFSFRARFNRMGAHRLSISSEDGDAALGSLLIRPVRLAAVGDVTFGGRIAATTAGRGAAHAWLATGRVLRGADLATANLEGVVSTRGRPVPDKEFHFRGPPSTLSAARRVAGLDVVSVANNHTLDFGTVAFLDTLRIARRNGIQTVGGGMHVTAARRPVILTRGGLRIAFLGYSDVRPEGFTAAASVAGTAPADPAAIRADVVAARRRADVIVVWFHWGEELARRPDPRQSALAAAALNARAHLVLGSHAHVLQHVLRPSRRTLVAWSLGNFVFPPHSPGTDRTGILLIDFGADGVRAHRLVPARIVGVQPRLLR
jgi:poly-gamma-glutamate capsule biosynthesis protein CapA/YwtB (metallophosphatase superfamily)